MHLKAEFLEQPWREFTRLLAGGRACRAGKQAKGRRVGTGDQTADGGIHQRLSRTARSPFDRGVMERVEPGHNTRMPR